LSSEVAVTSINTNASAIAAVDILRAQGTQVLNAQQEVATGYRVKDASDNAAYWSIATQMKSDNKALSAAEDSLAFGAAAVDVAYTGLNQAIDVIRDIRNKLLTALGAGAEINKINDEIQELRTQLRTVAEQSSFNGENWLVRDDASDDKDRELVGSFQRASNGSVEVKILRYSMSNALGTNHLIDEDSQLGILTNPGYATAIGAGTDWVMLNGTNDPDAHTEFAVSQTTTDVDITEMMEVADNMLEAMIDASSNLGALNKRIEMQNDFVKDLQDTQDRGVGRMVDSDLNLASSRLRAVEAQRSLTISALSIANSQPLTTLRLLQ
jgi:flagellin